MDQPLSNAPGFIYVKDLSTALVLNKHAEAIVFTDDLAEIRWLFNWILAYRRYQLRPLELVLTNPKKQSTGQHSKPESKTRRLVAAPENARTTTEPNTRPKYERRPAHMKGGARRQLIGEQIGPTRLHQLRIFQTRQEAEKWAGEGAGRRFRFATIGSVGWTRALDEEMKTLQQAQSAHLVSNE